MQQLKNFAIEAHGGLDRWRQFWCARTDEGEARLRAISQPALVVHGSGDTMLPSINAYNMFKAMNNAQLILYPDSGHGALFQYPERFVGHCRTFLEE